MDSDVVDSKTGVAHNDDPSDWGKTSYGVGFGGSFVINISSISCGINTL